MKKTLLIAGAIAFAGTASAQIFSEDFESPSMPAGWGVTTQASDGGWNIGTSQMLGSASFPFEGNNTRFAGTNDDKCNCDKSDDFLYTADVNLAGQSGSVFLSFKQYYFELQYQGRQESATIEISTNGGTSYSVLSSIAPIAAWATAYYDMSAYAGQSVKIGFRYSDGNGFNYGMGIDDVTVFAPVAKDYSLMVLNLPSYFKRTSGTLDIKGTVKNFGSETITSMDVSYSIDGGAAVVANLTGLSIAPLTDYDFIHSTPWTTGTDGKFNVEVNVTAVNGGADSDISDNVMSEDVIMYNEVYDRTVLYETFTSSTCPPCVPGNANFENISSMIVDKEKASIKYQMSWPGNGDPYNTDDGNTRRGYYNISSVPGMEIDGGWDGNSNSFTMIQHDDAMVVPAFASIWAEYHVSVVDQKVTTCVIIESLQDLGTATLQIAIKESRTTANVGSNGESEFFDVVKKMVPDANGTQVNITAGMRQEICKEYTFKGNYRLPFSANDIINDNTEHSVENFNNLEVVAWLQDNSTKVVFNATNGISTPLSVKDVLADASKVSVYPNPAVASATVLVNAATSGVASIKVIDMVGKTVINNSVNSVIAGNNRIELNTSVLESGIYFVEVMINGAVSTTQLVIQK